jgi:hypothetical protein
MDAMIKWLMTRWSSQRPSKGAASTNGPTAIQMLATPRIGTLEPPFDYQQAGILT